MCEPLPLTFVADLTDGAEGRVFGVSATANGHGLAIVGSLDDWNRTNASGADARAPYPATFIEHDGQGVLRTIRLDAVPVPFPMVQTLPGGEVLVISSRSDRYPDGTFEHNAFVYDERGTLRRTFTLGDGIEHVQTTTAGSIWVGYLDEGVFGDSDIASTGIVVFDSDGQVSWRFEPRGEIPYIDDCYALNVAENETWAYYFRDFPIVRIAHGELTGWRSSVSGAKALAVDRDRVLLTGGYSRPDRVVLATLTGTPGANKLDGQVDQVSEFTLRASDGTALRQATVIGRGGTLHTFNGPDWYRVDVADM